MINNFIIVNQFVKAITLKDEIYSKLLKVSSQKEIVEKFYNTLRITNRSFDFFVNWTKVISYLKEYKIELNILNTLIHDNDFETTLRKILSNYPNVLPIIPLLIAYRKTNFSVISNFSSDIIENYNFDFRERNLQLEEIEEIINFFKETGLENFFINIANKSIPDYYVGVEVGLDSHARKNRSGKVMENVIFEALKVVNRKTKNSFGIITQKKYKFLESKYGYKIPKALSDRQADFLLIKNNQKIIAIETNFYSDTGSKPQEIVNSYIQRQNELKKIGIDFIWITDGFGWKKQKNQMNLAFERLDYVLNINFIKKGLLEEIIMSI